MTSIIASIQPKWCELIACGKKTVEVRKTAPKEVPFKVYMYCTKVKDRKKYTDEFDVPMETRKWMGNGKVIGEFVCDKVETYMADDFVGAVGFDGNIITKPIPGEFGYWIPNEERTCLTYKEILEYGGGKNIYGWNISNLKIYDKPKKISEFRTPWKKPRKDSTCTVSHIISRPPQSWMYCEEDEK